MDIEEFKKLINKYKSNHDKYLKKCKTAERYYAIQNDILDDHSPANRNKERSDNPLKAADNRIAHSYHRLLVNQKASYLFTAPPMFDVGNKTLNTKITEMLGDDFSRECKDLCINAANSRSAWIHVWMDTNNKFQYALVNSTQIIPIYNGGLKKALQAVIRTYLEENQDDYYVIYEYWDSIECTSFRRKKNADTRDIEVYNRFNAQDLDSGASTQVAVYKHNFEEVPFIEFKNNNINEDDLTPIKSFIDVQDFVLSGYVNDIDDIQQLIWVLTNYGGTDLNEFREDLKKYKTINMESSGPDDKSGVQTIAVDIPVEARMKLLQLTRKLIFEHGQGLDPYPESGYGDSSGVALSFMYTPLELKSGLTETEFRTSFNKLIRLMAKSAGYKEYFSIIQTWTRSRIRNELEVAQICNLQRGIVSEETLVETSPLVENTQRELDRKAKENNSGEPPMFTTGGDS